VAHDRVALIADVDAALHGAHAELHVLERRLQVRRGKVRARARNRGRVDCFASIDNSIVCDMRFAIC